MAEKNRSVVESIRRSSNMPIRYCGPDYRKKFLFKLIEDSKQESSSIQFTQSASFFTDNAAFSGGIRNLALLLTAGQTVLSFDDDVLHNYRKISSRYSKRANPDDHPVFLCFGTRKQLLKSTIPIDTHITDFSALLHLQTNMNDQHLSRPKIGMAGVYGDKWFTNPYALLSVSKEYRSKVWPRFQAFSMARTEPHVLLLSPEVSYSESPFFVSTCFLYNANEILPPFLPGIRASDSIWAWMIRLMYPNSPIMHLPIAIEHSTDGRNTFAENDFKNIRFSMAELLNLLLEYSAIGIPALSPREVLIALGEKIIIISKLSPNALRELCSELVFVAIAKRIKEYNHQIEMSGGRPKPWNRAVSDHIELLKHLSGQKKIWCPKELNNTPRGKRIVQLKDYLFNTGCMLLDWSGLWTSAMSMEIR